MAARLAAARVLLTLDRAPESEQEMRALVASNQRNPAAWELLGDALSAESRASDAAEAYARAARLTGDAQRRNIERKAARARESAR